MNKQEQVLNVLKIASYHGMNKLYAARYLHVFGLGEIISRLKLKSYKIITVIVNPGTEISHVKYILIPSNIIIPFEEGVHIA